MRALTIIKQKDLPAETKLKEIPPDEQAILDCIARTKKFVRRKVLNLLRCESEFLINEIENRHQHRHVHRYVDAGYRETDHEVLSSCRS